MMPETEDEEDQESEILDQDKNLMQYIGSTTVSVDKILSKLLMMSI